VSIWIIDSDNQFELNYSIFKTSVPHWNNTPISVEYIRIVTFHL